MLTGLALLAMAGVCQAGKAEPLVHDVRLQGRIAGENITFTLDFTAETSRRNQSLPLVAGDVILTLPPNAEGDGQVSYNASNSTYALSWRKAGIHPVQTRLAARAKLLESGAWREAQFSLPTSQLRQIEVACDRTDLEVRFPGALRVTREVRDGTLVITAILGPGHPFTVRWKPQVAEMEAKLVVACEANTIATAGGGAMRSDTHFNFDISQGKLRELRLAIPESQSVTQVRGSHIRDWRLLPGSGAAPSLLEVILNQAQTKQYSLQVISEQAVGNLPTELELAVIQPLDCIRSGGYLSVGTDSAIHLLVKQSTGLSQIDEAAFPRVRLDSEHSRPLPTNKAFFFMYAAGSCQLTLALSDIVPSFEVSQRLVLNVKEDDLILTADLEVEVRDAPIRSIRLQTPKGFAVADLSGSEVKDYNISKGPSEKDTPEAQVFFRRPVTGRTLIRLRLEYGRSPLNLTAQVTGLRMPGAKSERGYLVVTGEDGVHLGQIEVGGLREVHTGSVPIRVSNAQFAYRFRESHWHCQLEAKAKPSSIRAELFQLVSLGQEILYGSVTANYFITGGPVDELRFRLPEGLRNVEFVGRDVRRWVREGEDWVVKLKCRVIGDYNLGLSYTQPYHEGETIAFGGLTCESVDSQTGFIVIASHLNLNLTDPATGETPMLQVDRTEIPANYRLLVNAPMLRIYKYVRASHAVRLQVEAYERETVLPVVVEMTDLNTKIGLRQGSESESVTRVRYKIKNTTSQFLELIMPAGAKPWATRMIEQDRSGQVKITPVQARQDQGRLLIPLKRYRNPNDPVTLELEYGQTHPSLDQGMVLPLVAPGALIRSTFARWTLTVPEKWAVYPAQTPSENQANMIPQERHLPQTNLAGVMKTALACWQQGLARMARRLGPQILIALLVLGAGLLLLAKLVRRRIWLGVVSLMLLVSLALVGLRGVGTPAYRQARTAHNAPTSISFVRALNLDLDTPPAIAATIVPAWRGLSSPRTTVALGTVALLLLALGLWRKRFRGLLVAAALTTALLAAARLPVMLLPLLNLLLWGLPLLLAFRQLTGLWNTGRDGLRRKKAPVGAVCLGLLLLQAIPAEGKDPAAPENTCVEHVQCDLVAEQDSMAIQLGLQVTAPKAMQIRLLDLSAVLLSKPDPGKYLSVKRDESGYLLDISRKGRYHVALEFLAPLAPESEELSRRFRLPLPLALANHVTLRVPVPGLRIEAPNAILFNTDESDHASSAAAVFAPGEDLLLHWKPRMRKVKQEDTVFFSEVVSLLRFDSGVVGGRHRLRFQVAQGELTQLLIGLPAGLTVTGLQGENIGAWRFDPARRQLEVRLSQGATGEYLLSLVTQMSATELPYAVEISNLSVQDAARQRGILGLAVSPTVSLDVQHHPQPMNLEDFVRDAAVVLASFPGVRPNDVRHAYRSQSPEERVSLQVREVLPEIRTAEAATFSISDERLIYNGTFSVDIAKAGVFTIALEIPQGYDIDALSAPEVSHWDDSESGSAPWRGVQVHLLRRLTGKVDLKVTLSRSVSQLPEQIQVPRLRVAKTQKHSGQLIVSTDRGVRLAVAKRSGVSELNLAELGLRSHSGLAFKLLAPDWQLALQTEVLQPRIIVESLHVASVTDGMVRHSQHLRFQIHNAGSKVFDIQVPANVLGLVLEGPDIARTDELTDLPGHWRIELANKWFDRAYPLKVSYETPFNRDKGEISIHSLKALSAELQRGYLVLNTTDRVALEAISAHPNLQAAEARAIPREFGGEDHSQAAFCYRSTSGDYQIGFRATRHEAAGLLKAQVQNVDLVSVITAQGESINRLQMQLSVGDKRHLEAVLPEGADVWSYQINRRPMLPSLKKSASGQKTLLLPLGAAAVGTLPVTLELIYVVPRTHDWKFARQDYKGPQFDLPLQHITWALYLPEGAEYDDFAGTMTVRKTTVSRKIQQSYDLNAYESGVQVSNVKDLQTAVQLQNQASLLISKGQQYAAKQALESAWRYSQSDQALNEDARVQLHQLNRDQAIVGLIGRRDHLRQKMADGTPSGADASRQQDRDLGDRFNLADAERLQNSLSKADSENLELITERMIDMQTAAAEANAQLIINMPLRGRKVEFYRDLQVNPGSPMNVSCQARSASSDELVPSLLWGAGLFGLLLLFGCGRARSGKASDEPEHKT
jgi:hypothetical protein